MPILGCAARLLGNEGGAAEQRGLRLTLAPERARLDVQVGARHRARELAPLLQLPLPLPAGRMTDAVQKIQSDSM